MDDTKQQIVDSLKQANNILVTVRNNPSLDQLSACIALTLVLNDLNKHATAVFSGEVPSVLEFLEPGKTIERNTDSLQDFIISLDKSKADKLRYKVEDSVVKIFITPYKTSITDKDLEFGQGDFNVDVVVALGVHNQDDLDQAITSHGQILHDATVISMNTQPGGGDELGSVNWTDTDISSLSEMVASFANDLGKEDAIDNQVATALLTGIVAETERFGNAKTSSSTMEMAAKLLTAGANQELVASKLAEPEKPAEEEHHEDEHHDGDGGEEHHDDGDQHDDQDHQNDTDGEGEHSDDAGHDNSDEHHDDDENHDDGNHDDDDHHDEPPKPPSEPGTIEISHPDDGDNSGEEQTDGGMISLISPPEPAEDSEASDEHHDDEQKDHGDKDDQDEHQDNQDDSIVPVIPAMSSESEPSDDKPADAAPEPAADNDSDGGSLISALPLTPPTEQSEGEPAAPESAAEDKTAVTDDTESDDDDDEETDDDEEAEAPKAEAGPKMMTHHAVIQPLPSQDFGSSPAAAPASSAPAGLDMSALAAAAPDMASAGPSPMLPPMLSPEQAAAPANTLMPPIDAMPQSMSAPGFGQPLAPGMPDLGNQAMPPQPTLAPANDPMAGLSPLAPAEAGSPLPAPASEAQPADMPMAAMIMPSDLPQPPQMPPQPAAPPQMQPMAPPMPPMPSMSPAPPMGNPNTPPPPAPPPFPGMPTPFNQ